MKFLSEFKKFISRGNVFDLAIGVVIGGAFGKIVSSLVNDILNPLIGLFLVSDSLSELKWVLKKATETSEEVAISYGIFLQNILNFIIISFVIFLFVRSYNKLKEKEDAKNKKEIEDAKVEAEKKLTLDQELLSEIRDLLQRK